MIEISRNDIDAIFDSMGNCDGVLAFTKDFQVDPPTPAIIISTTLVPLFWVTVATWYCELEHRDNADLVVFPGWAPLDLTNLNFTVSYLYGTDVLVITGFKVLD